MISALTRERVGARGDELSRGSEIKELILEYRRIVSMVVKNHWE